MWRWVLSESVPGRLRREASEPPRPAPDELLVRIRAASLNHRDLYVRDAYPDLAGVRPLVPLSDGVGEVVAVGTDVDEGRLGTRVMGSFFRGWVSGPSPGPTCARRWGVTCWACSQSTWLSPAPPRSRFPPGWTTGQRRPCRAPASPRGTG